MDLLDIAADFDTDLLRALPHADRMAFRAMKNALTEIGEAVKTLPSDFKTRHPELDWRGFAGLWDMIAHQYFSLDTKKLLTAVKEEIPGLLAAVEAGLHPLGERI